jgi:DNA-binding MarR family transcriptional regulator
MQTGHMRTKTRTELTYKRGQSGEQVKRYNESSLTQAQWAALRFYATNEQDEATIGRFGTFFRITPSSASQSTKRLKEKGFIKTFPSKDDGRQQCIVLTARGEKQLEKDPLEGILDLAKEMNPSEISDLGYALMKFVRSLYKATEETK